MGSQTIEILRQGVWASFTGGWFYDPHQNIFCNAIHLYLFLFLLCTPFVTYLYFSRTVASWTVYCCSAATTIIAVKLVNLILHVMYDQAQIVSENNSKKPVKVPQETSGTDDGGIEMQILAPNSMVDPTSRTSIENNNNNSNEISQANSVISIDYPAEQNTSTIDLKVDVHRKNSSESSDSLTEVPSNHGNGVAAQHVDRRSIIMKTKSKSEDTSTMTAADATKELRLVDEGDLLSRSEERRDKFVDTDGGGLQRISDSKKRMRSKLQRQTSLDSSGPDMNNFPVRRPVSSNHLHRQQHHGSGFYHPNHLPSLTPEMYLEPHFTTKSELAIERFVSGSKKAPMRKDSTSTMSAIQLPTNSGASTSSTTRQRRYSNTAKTQQQPLTSGMVSVRRIKSTALEKCCPQPSYSNLSPHPNSVETINGRPLRNPPHAILPPPSKSLVRNQHLNFFPKGTSGSIEPVYPIAEIVDEKSLNESFVLTSESDDDALSGSNDEDDNDNDDEDDDDNDNNFAVTVQHQLSSMHKLSSKTKSMSFTERRRQRTTPDNDSSNSVKKHSSELEIDRPRTHSTDSENEMNNGSQSPLLETRARTSIFRSNSPKNECDTKTNDNENEPKTDGTTANTDGVEDAYDAEEGAVGGVNSASIIVPKSEDSGCPSSDCEQASASSKDMLLSKKSKSSERNWHDFNMDANTISVDLTENASSATKEATTSAEPQDQKLAKDTSKSLGAIPKTSFSRYEMNEETKNGMKTNQHEGHDHNCGTNTKSLSHASSANSLSGGSYNSSNSLNKNVLQVMQQTEDGWVLQSASPNNPYLVAQRGELLPIYNNNTRQDNIFPVSRKPYLYLHQQRQYHPKIRSTRNRMQNSSIDTTASSRDEDDSMSMTGATGGGSMGFDMKISERLSTLFFPELAENQTLGAQSTQRSTINRMTFADSMFWGHCNLPIDKKVQPKRYYKFPIKCLKREIKISMDRLQLLALFDRDCGTCQATASILVGICCSILGAVVLQLDFYRDIFAFIFCFVMAGAQYSLLKSVQPDASSSTHGDDARYSRPIYFCLCTSILILSHHFSTFPKDENQLTLFGIPFSTRGFFYSIQEIMSIILLLFPVLFSLGLFAQVNTFLMYALEQFDMHLFGGNAVCSLISAFFGIFKSIMACCMLYGFALGGLSEPRSTQHVLFSCFCALLVASAYHLSRSSASDFTYLWAIIQSSFIINHDEDEELRRATKLSKFEKNKPVKKKNESNIKTKISINDKERQTEGNQTGSSNIQFDSSDAQKDSNESVAIDSGNMSEQKVILTAEGEGVLEKEELDDPLPSKLKNTVNARLKNDFLMCTVIGTIVLSLHSSTVFTALQPELNPVLRSFVIVLGFLLHYLIPQMRKYLPWLCFAKPILKQKEYGMYETSEAAKIMWFETLFVYLSFVEKNILLPLIFISALTSDSVLISQKFGIPIGSAIVVLCGLKSIRSSYSDPSSQYIIILFTVLFFGKDYKAASETFLIDYFVVSIVYKKTCEFLLKLQFIVTYIAPWQITWGSAFHAFAQPFSVPHSAMLFLQAVISSLLSAPLIPFLGSAIFLTSYTRPIKFWERDYNTRRIDHSNTRLSSHLERDLGADDNNLNSIFYEHLTRSLQHSLCGDLLLGRWGNVSQGDCFVLASDYLNCLVHIIELGNGLCTFQMRGLEFRGTYCQQREVEAISEGVGENDGCCCCSPGHLPNCLSINAMFSTRWLAWQVVASQYILEGYSISDNLAQATLQVYEFRKVLITYYIKCIIYYTIRSPKLHSWLASQAIEEALQGTQDRSFVDLDPIFNHNLDEDFDFRASGITRSSFCSVYFDWIQFCYEKRIEVHKSKHSRSQEEQQKSRGQSQSFHRSQTENLSGISTSETTGGSPKSSNNQTPSPRISKSDKNNDNNPQAQPTDITQKSTLISLLLALSLLARRTLATATHTHSSLSGVEFFLHGLHALFKGDYRITSIRDEWIFLDMDLLHTVVAPAVKMSLKLHQDHFLSPEEYEDPAALYNAITTHTNELVISHEADPLWRNAVLRGAPQLLALRHILEEGSDEYRLIRLSKRYLSFRVIKLNRECVRGLWAGQQQELIYLRNRNPERGSIQNAKQALRNIINSSCDLPLGYPIYVSPLLPSYAETNEQLCKIVGGAITLDKIKNIAWRFCQHVRQRFSEGCSSGSATLDTEVGDIGVYYAPSNTPNNTISATTGTLSYGSQSLSGAGTRGSVASMGKPNNSTLLAGFLNREREQERESINSDRSGMGVYRKRASVITKTEQDRRATFPSSSPIDIIDSKEMDTSISGNKSHISPETSMLTASSSPNPTSSRAYRPNSSFSSGNLSTRNTNRTLIISERKSKSEERQSSHDNDAFDVTMPETKGILLSTSISLPSTTQTSATLLDTVPKYSNASLSCMASSNNSSILPSPPKIPLNRKVIIVSTLEIYDCLDLGRRIDVLWPNECMRMNGGRSSWKKSLWEPQEGMIGYTRHFWQPLHPNKRFRSNFNRTLFLVQIGEHFVPVSENGVKEYNTIGIDDRFRNVAPTFEVEVPAENENDSDTILDESDQEVALKVNETKSNLE
ncbi:protein pecanex [Sitodiplosis mosellana]|uniref:protein pecanex n=1 Tax=Sitodiplosis mosellana TaxID=263140 RepID=UPI00244517A4|nr:protein pecanex [Sitodiplosis mosellana]